MQDAPICHHFDLGALAKDGFYAVGRTVQYVQTCFRGQKKKKKKKKKTTQTSKWHPNSTGAAHAYLLLRALSATT